MKLYTKRGDDGSTGLIGGARVSKDDPRVVACGNIDETNAAIGMVVANCTDDATGGTLRQIQSELFILGAELAAQKADRPELMVGDAHVARLEKWIDEVSAEVSPLKGFILPGGSEIASRLHLARAVCRRAERATVALARQQPVDRSALAYLNRLSDLLFALARLANAHAGVVETPWTAPKS